MKRRRALLLLAVGSAVGFLALAWVAEEQYLLPVDRAAHALIQSEQDPSLERAMTILSRAAEGYMLVLINVVAFFLLRLRDRRLALFLPAVTLGAFGVGALAKWVVARPRPNEIAYGFPSGHVLTAVVFFGALVYVLWRLEERRLWRWIGAVFCAGVVTGVAGSRLYLNYHWVSDVLGGLAGGAAFLLFVLLAVHDRLRPETPGPRS